jgi:hypothetical protein
VREGEEEVGSEDSDGDAFSDGSSSGSSSDDEDFNESAAEIQKEDSDKRLFDGTTVFKTGKMLADALRQHATARHYKITCTSRGGSSKKYCCSFAPGCPVYINVRKLLSGDYHVSEALLEHAPDCSAFPDPSVKNVAKLKLFNSLIAGNRGASAKEMGALVQVRIFCLAARQCLRAFPDPTPRHSRFSRPLHDAG